MVVGWVVVLGWLVLWAEVERRHGTGPPLDRAALTSLAGEAVVLTLFSALWFGSLGAGGWWLVFVLVGALREWPLRSRIGGLRLLRIFVSGGILALWLGA
jgi:hypothetical protein